MYVSKVYEMPVDAYGDVRTLVRGLPYQCPDDWEDVLDSLDEDSNLYLVKEPDNPKDELAIAAYLEDRRVGYVAASDNGKIWLYMTDDKMPCTFIERFDASFKISFENPRSLYENKSFAEIYRDKDGISDRPIPAFEIPFLTNPKDKHYNWFDDKILIADLERAIPDFRRKLATRFIIMVGRKNKKGEYCYYLPYHNRPIADVEDGAIQGLIDRYGFVIALPDVPKMTNHGGIIMDLHVTYLKNTDFKDFNSKHHSQLVFNLTRDFVNILTEDDEDEFDDDSREDNDDRINSLFEGKAVSASKYQTTKHNYRDDYILKEGEYIDSHVNKMFFNEIDKITTDLYTFVRQKLFPSNELFLYLRKHTPYWKRFNNFGEFETLIRVFVIKDLGRIYTSLNHSINFDTSEGKVMFLYMIKETGENPNEDFDAFEKSCITDSPIEAIVKLRAIVERQMKLFYEYDIHRWVVDDFMIHSFLKEIDQKLANRYMEILNRFVSAVEKVGISKNQNSFEISTNKSVDRSSSINNFFPLFGITLGKTTWKQAEDMGNEVKKWREGPCMYMDVENVTFWDFDGVGRFTSLDWFYHSVDFPLLWKSKGFSWDNSYNKWMDVFRKLDFSISVTQQPTQNDNVFKAGFEALSPDGNILFKMVFDHGEDGDNTSSSKTLDTISVDYKGACLQEEQTFGSHEYPEEGETYKITDTPDGGKHVSLGVIVPNEDDMDFDFCTYDCSISDPKQIDLITRYMKRYEEGKETRPFLMIGRLMLGTSSMCVFYSLDGEIIFDYIFEKKIKGWIKEAGFVLGKIKKYERSFNGSLNLSLSVSKRKCGETLFKKASEEAMDYIEEKAESTADYKLEVKIIKAVNDYLTGKTDSPYQVLVSPNHGLGLYTTLDGVTIAYVEDYQIQKIADVNDGAVGFITDFEYDEDEINVKFNIRVSRSMPGIDIEPESYTSNRVEVQDRSSSLNDFFPLFGIILGETTWKQAEDMGHAVEIWKGGPTRKTRMEGMTLWDDDGKGVFTSLYWIRPYMNAFFPSIWESKGFSWDNSYDEWMDVFKKLGFNVTVKQQPSQKDFCGRTTLSAIFEALSPDGKLLFEMIFDCGDAGCYTSSPKTLYTIIVNFKNKT